MGLITEYELDPQFTAKKLYVTTFTNVKDITKLHQKITSGVMECCCLKPNLIIDPLQLQIAVTKTFITQKYGQFLTRNQFTEIIYNLNPSRSIVQSLQRFGISTEDTKLIVVILAESLQEANIILKDDFCHGEQETSFPNEYVDLKAIQKLYQIPDQELRVSSLVNSVVSRIATKEFQR